LHLPEEHFPVTMFFSVPPPSTTTVLASAVQSEKFFRQGLNTNHELITPAQVFMALQSPRFRELRSPLHTLGMSPISNGGIHNSAENDPLASVTFAKQNCSSYFYSPLSAGEEQ
jgi:hypothetical protein